MKNTQDLLHGNIRRELIALTIPLVLGNILQQFYRWVVARFRTAAPRQPRYRIR